MRTRHVAVAGAILSIAAGLALGGCSGKGGSAHPAASPSAAMNQAQLLALGREWSQCIRQHGIPDFPDLVVVDGYLALPEATGDAAKLKLSNNRAAQAACKSLEDRIPSRPRQSHAPLSAAEIRKRVQWAQCMRQHGVPDYPDPDSNGEFNNIPAQKTPTVIAAMNACKQFRPSGDGSKG